MGNLPAPYIKRGSDCPWNASSQFALGLLLLLLPLPSSRRCFVSTQSIFTMVIKIHGVAFSTCTQRVSTVLKELKLTYEIVNVPLSEFKSDAHLALQPFGQIPVLVRPFPSLSFMTTFISIIILFFFYLIRKTMASSYSKAVLYAGTSWRSTERTLAARSFPRVWRRTLFSSRRHPSKHLISSLMPPVSL